MSEIPTPTGPTNRELIDRAYLALGISDAMFGRTPEEYATGFALLKGMMAEWPFNLLGFIMEDSAGGRIEEASGIDPQWTEAVGLCLGERLAGALKMQFPSMGAKARAYSQLCGAVGTITSAQFPSGTFAGSGTPRRTYLPLPE